MKFFAFIIPAALNQVNIIEEIFFGSYKLFNVKITDDYNVTTRPGGPGIPSLPGRPG